MPQPPTRTTGRLIDYGLSLAWVSGLTTLSNYFERRRREYLSSIIPITDNVLVRCRPAGDERRRHVLDFCGVHPTSTARTSALRFHCVPTLCPSSCTNDPIRMGSPVRMGSYREGVTPCYSHLQMVQQGWTYLTIRWGGSRAVTREVEGERCDYDGSSG